MKKVISSEQVRIRFIELLENGKLMMGDEIKKVPSWHEKGTQHLVNKLNLISLSEYAKLNNISKPAAVKRIEKEPTIKVHKLHYFVK
jgi:hypothetical protein